jgi:hypothetical protein
MTSTLIPRLAILRGLGPLLLVLLSASPAWADALIRTQAMLASSIAEYFVEPGRVRVALEIGLDDVPAFERLLPDEIRAELGLPARPFAERVREFFAQGLVIQDAAGRALPGRLLTIGPRERIARDDISGAPLEPEEGIQPEQVIFAELEYFFDGEPGRLVLLGLRAAEPVSIGFVVYHGAVPVNDFRYLTPAQTLSLDWSDPWYTRFERRALRRQYFAPMSGFLYIEPYEVRKEIVFRPLDLQRFVDLGIDGRTTIPVEIQPELQRRAAAFLREHQIVEIDGRRIEPELARINFLERSLRTSAVVDPPRELDVYSAVIGVIFLYPTEGLPERVTMDWDLWDERIGRVPVSAVDQAGPLPSYLEPRDPVLVWQNFLTNPELPTLVDVAPPPTRLERVLAPGRWALGALAVVAVLLAARTRRHVPTAALTVLLAAGAFWLGSQASVSDERARGVVGDLLHNVYRALDFRGEEAVYDALARSVEGDLLQQIYLETRRSMELASQGGARARVKGVELEELTAESAGDGAFAARAIWNVTGSVGHWGHVHQRRNRYRADLVVAPRDGAWKITALEILEESRL